MKGIIKLQADKCTHANDCNLSHTKTKCEYSIEDFLSKHNNLSYLINVWVQNKDIEIKTKCQGREAAQLANNSLSWVRVPYWEENSNLL